MPSADSCWPSGSACSPARPGPATPPTVGCARPPPWWRTSIPSSGPGAKPWQVPSPPAVHLRWCWCRATCVPPSSITALFDTTEAADQFGAWLAAPATLDHLRAAADALAGTPDTRRLTLAVDRLTRYRAARVRAV
jgi:hypothetical protein